MTASQSVQHRYEIGQICVFRNQGISGVRSNDGKRCRIIRLKLIEEWARDEPEYVIHFPDNDYKFGIRECELKPIEKKGG